MIKTRRERQSRRHAVQLDYRPALVRHVPAALPIGFVPPAQFGRSNPTVYAVLVLAGIPAIGIAPPLLLDLLRKPGWKAAGDRSASQL
jgi:hypothetical protein